MWNKLVVLVCVASVCLPVGVARAEEHKTEHKTEKKAEPKKADAHGEAKKAEPKKDEHGAAKKDEHAAAKPAAKQEAHAEAKPSPAPARPAATPRRATSRLAARAPAPRRATPAPKPAAAAKPAAPVPVVVEIKQEPTRVEAVLRVIPYDGTGGYAPGFSISPMNAPSYNTASLQTPAHEADAGEHDEHGTETAVAPFAPPPPTPRATLRQPKNALTNEGLVLLAQVGYDEDFILDLMRMKNCRFDTSVEGLAFLATHGLTERIIRAALTAEVANTAPLSAAVH